MNIMSDFNNSNFFNILCLIERNTIFKHYSLNTCNSNNNFFFYFNLVSNIFVILFSFLIILLAYMWGKSTENVFLLIQLNYYRNVLVFYAIYSPNSSEMQKISEKLFRLYKDLYNLDLKELSELKVNSIFWWEPWSYETIAYFPPFSKKFFNSPWHFYYKYRLSLWVKWHILEDRICIFVLLFLWILI